MNLRHFRTLHPDLLPGLFNTALRNDFEDLDDLCAFHDLDRAAVEERFAELGYRYQADSNQFRKPTGEG